MQRALGLDRVVDRYDADLAIAHPVGIGAVPHRSLGTVGAPLEKADLAMEHQGAIVMLRLAYLLVEELRRTQRAFMAVEHAIRSQDYAIRREIALEIAPDLPHLRQREMVAHDFLGASSGHGLFLLY